MALIEFGAPTTALIELESPFKTLIEPQGSLQVCH